MLDYIRGALDRLTPTEAVVEAGGLGYLIGITLTTYSAIRDKREVRLLVHEVIREDTHDLFGFADEQERMLFRLLIGVSGVGPNTARVILSSLTPSQLKMCITSGDHNKLKSVKGIGLKTAQRIIVDLKDKINDAELQALAAEQGAAPTSAPSEVQEEAQAALLMLGFQKQATQKALQRIFSERPDATVEQAIKLALSML